MFTKRVHASDKLVWDKSFLPGSLWSAVDILTLNLWTYFIFIYSPKASHWCKEKHEHTDGLKFSPPPPNPAQPNPAFRGNQLSLTNPSVNSHIFQDSFSTVPRNNAAHIILLLPSFLYRSRLLWLVLPSVKMSMFLQWMQYTEVPEELSGRCPNP